MKILGIDPGTATTGYGLLRLNGKLVPELLKFGWIETSKDVLPGNRLDEIYRSTQALLKEHMPDVLVIERLFFFSNQKTAIRVSQAQGVILLAAARARVPIFEYPPAQVKLSVSGSGRADKTLMKKTIRKLFNVRSPKKRKTHFDDVADAIAVALCHAKLISPLSYESAGRQRR